MRKIIFVLLIVINITGCYFGDENYFDPDWYDFDAPVQEKGDELYFDQTDYSYVYGNAVNLTDDLKNDIQTIYTYYETKNRNLTINEDTYGMFSGYNYLNIMLESLDLKFVHPDLTPTMYELINSSMIIDDYYNVEFQPGATCNNEFMTLTSLYPFGSNTSSNNICNTYSKNKFEFALPNQFESAGYDSYYFHAGEKTFYNREELIPNYGFTTSKFRVDLYDDYDIEIDMAKDSGSIEFFKNYIDYDYYKEEGNNFYINYLSYTTHGGYSNNYYLEEHDEVVTSFIKNNFNDTIADTLKVYYSKIYEVEIFITELLDLLKQEGIYDNTIITLARDHSPYMLDKNIYLNHLNDRLGYDIEGIDYYKDQYIIHVPNGEKKLLDVSMSTVDIAPTILKLFGIKANFNYFSGVDIFNTDDNYIYMPPVEATNYQNCIIVGSYFYSSGDEMVYTNVEDDNLDIFLIKYEDRLKDNLIISRVLTTNFFDYF